MERSAKEVRGHGTEAGETARDRHRRGSTGGCGSRAPHDPGSERPRARRPRSVTISGPRLPDLSGRKRLGLRRRGRGRRRGQRYVTGNTSSTDFPATAGAFAAIGDGDIDQGDAFVAKLKPDGSGLEYATYLGGTGSDRGNAIAVDAQGSAYVTGQTESADFPVTAGAFDTSYNSGEGDAFVAKLSPDGSTLEYSTYLGGTDWEGNEGAEAIAVDARGSAYVTGRTHAPNFPITPGAFDATLTSPEDESTRTPSSQS